MWVDDPKRGTISTVAPAPDSPDALPPGGEGSLAGHLLVAPPQLTDPNFAGSVVLLLLHHAEGAFGLVLNDPIPGLDPGEVVPRWREALTTPVLRGGPVQRDAVVALARPRHGTTPAGFRTVVPALGPLGTVDLEDEPDGDLAVVRLFAGYSGWGPGQLEGELALGGWVVVDAHPDDAFTEDVTGLWGRVLRRHHGAAAPEVRTLPDDLSLN